MSIYKKVMRRARNVVQDNERIRVLLMGTARKLSIIDDESRDSKGLLSRIKLMIRMVQNHLNGAYKGLSPITLLMVVFALIYFVTPTDLLPDFVPALGFTDDLAVVALVIRRFQRDIEKFQEWEESRISE